MNEPFSPPTHRTLMVRCWSERDAIQARQFWRFHLHWLDTDEQQGFPNLEELLHFLTQAFYVGDEHDE